VGQRVVITQWIHPHIVELLSRSLEVVPNMTGKSLSREELLRRAQDAQGIMAFPTDVIDEDLLDWCADLIIVAGAFDGLGRVDVQAWTYRGVWVTNVSGPSTPPFPASFLSRRRSGLSAEEERRMAALALEAAANIFEAFIEERPKGAVNSPHRRLRPKRPIHAPSASSS